MSLTAFSQSIMYNLHQLRIYLPDVAIALGIIWGVNIVNWLILRSRLTIFGIYPRHIWGLWGIVFAPILHGNFNHLFFNTIPAVVLVLCLLLHGMPVFLACTFIIVILSGLLTWLLGRSALHIGMSGVIAGYFSLLMIFAIKSPSFISIGPAVIMLYYFGGIALSWIPTDEKASWEGHLFGLISGIAAYFIYMPVLYYYFLWF